MADAPQKATFEWECDGPALAAPVVNGHRMDSTTSVTVTADAGALPEVTIRLLPVDLLRLVLSGDHALARVDEGTRAALISLGWTPPAAAGQPAEDDDETMPCACGQRLPWPTQELDTACPACGTIWQDDGLVFRPGTGIPLRQKVARLEVTGPRPRFSPDIASLAELLCRVVPLGQATRLHCHRSIARRLMLAYRTPAQWLPPDVDMTAIASLWITEEPYMAPGEWEIRDGKTKLSGRIKVPDELTASDDAPAARPGTAVSGRPRQVPQWPTAGALAKAIDPGTIQAPALDAIDQALEELHATPGGRLIVTVPPQEGHAERVTRTGTLWALTRNRDTRVGIVSCSQALAEAISRDVRNLIVANSGEEGTLDLGLRIAPDWDFAQRWQLDGHRGGAVAAGIESRLAGRPIDYLVIDLTADSEQAKSAYYRDRRWEWWQSVGSTRLSPDAPVCLVLTRWHEDDLGRLLKAVDTARWQVINVTAMAGHRPEEGGQP